MLPEPQSDEAVPDVRPLKHGTMTRAGVQLSVVIPLFNEEDSIPHLCERLFGVLDKLFQTFEVIAVNDGSTDRSLAILREEAAKRPQLRVLDLRRNYGQTAALMAGFDHAKGGIIVTMDADLQNDPEDIPALISKIFEGYDVASGWRHDRQDARVRRNFVSRVANRLISRISGLTLRDYGCTLKAYRREVMDGVRLYGEMHRFIPIYARSMGAKVIEVPVRHHARRFGSSKYGVGRMFKVLLDLAVIEFLDRYLVKPIYVFGGFGLLMVFFSFAALAIAIALRLVAGTSLIQTPLPLLSAILLLMGCISFLMGFLAEILMRTYFESQGRYSYQVREQINCGPQA
jgi:glycosyltransferase involved in cell wall biosynthesis